MVEPTNINPTAQDCYFFFYSTCVKGSNCHFRHASAALGSEVVCDLWANGTCTRPVCAFRHGFLDRQRWSIPCYWETQSSGCLKTHCPFKHEKQRPSLPSVQDRVSKYKFDSIHIKSLSEIKQKQEPGQAPPSELKHSMFKLENVLDDLSQRETHKNTVTLTDDSSCKMPQRHIVKQRAQAVLESKKLFRVPPRAEPNPTSIFSPDFNSGKQQKIGETTQNPEIAPVNHRDVRNQENLLSKTRSSTSNTLFVHSAKNLERVSLASVTTESCVNSKESVVSVPSTFQHIQDKVGRGRRCSVPQLKSIDLDFKVKSLAQIKREKRKAQLELAPQSRKMLKLKPTSEEVVRQDVKNESKAADAKKRVVIKRNSITGPKAVGLNRPLTINIISQVPESSFEKINEACLNNETELVSGGLIDKTPDAVPKNEVPATIHDDSLLDEMASFDGLVTGTLSTDPRDDDDLMLDIEEFM